MADEDTKFTYVCGDDEAVKAAMQECTCGHPMCAAVGLVRAALVLILSDDRIGGDLEEAHSVLIQCAGMHAQNLANDKFEVVLIPQGRDHALAQRQFVGELTARIDKRKLLNLSKRMEIDVYSQTTRLSGG